MHNIIEDGMNQSEIVVGTYITNDIGRFAPDYIRIIVAK
jgi:hypothetical protein